MFYLRQIAVYNSRPKSLDGAIALVTGLLNTVFIPRPRGVVSNENVTDKAYETTSFSVIKLPQLKRLYYKDYNNQQWKMIDLNRLDFSKYSEIPLADGTLGVKDVTDTINEGGESTSRRPKAMKLNERKRQRKGDDNDLF